MKKKLPITIGADFIAKLLSGSKAVPGKTKKISKHINFVSALIVEPVKNKYEYAPDVKELFKKGMPVGTISEVLNISKSYVYKLLKK